MKLGCAIDLFAVALAAFSILAIPFACEHYTWSRECNKRSELAKILSILGPNFQDVQAMVSTTPEARIYGTVPANQDFTDLKNAIADKFGASEAERLCRGVRVVLPSVTTTTNPHESGH